MTANHSHILQHTTCVAYFAIQKFRYHPPRPFKIIEDHVVRQRIYNFLLMFNSKCSSVLHHYGVTVAFVNERRDKLDGNMVPHRDISTYEHTTQTGRQRDTFRQHRHTMHSMAGLKNSIIQHSKVLRNAIRTVCIYNCSPLKKYILQIHSTFLQFRNMSQEEAKYAHHNQRKILNTQCVTKYRLFVVLFNFQVMGLSC